MHARSSIPRVQSFAAATTTPPLHHLRKRATKQNTPPQLPAGVRKKKIPCRQISQHPKRRFEASIACRATSCSPSLDIIPRSRVAARRHQDHAQSMMINTQKSIFYSWFVTDRWPSHSRMLSVQVNISLPDSPSLEHLNQQSMITFAWKSLSTQKLLAWQYFILNCFLFIQH
jgi:hypothetical protein